MDLPIRTVALYQSKRLFGANVGVRYYGDVVRCTLVKRSEIWELPKDSDELYYCLDLKKWKKLSKPIKPKEVGGVSFFSNRFLLEHSAEVPELKLRSEAEYRLFTELKRALNSTEINDEEGDIGFRFGDAMIVFEEGKINVYRDGAISAQSTVEAFTRSPNAVFRVLEKSLV